MAQKRVYIEANTNVYSYKTNGVFKNFVYRKTDVEKKTPIFARFLIGKSFFTVRITNFKSKGRIKFVPDVLYRMLIVIQTSADSYRVRSIDLRNCMEWMGEENTGELYWEGELNYTLESLVRTIDDSLSAAVVKNNAGDIYHVRLKGSGPHELHTKMNLQFFLRTTTTQIDVDVNDTEDKRAKLFYDTVDRTDEYGNVVWDKVFMPVIEAVRYESGAKFESHELDYDDFDLVHDSATSSPDDVGYDI